MSAVAAGAEIATISLRGSTGLSLDECRQSGSQFAELVARSAVEYGVEPRALSVRTLLQLPRVARYNGCLRQRDLAAELRASAVSLRADQDAIAALIPVHSFPLQDLRFVEYRGPETAAIFGRLHYLRSARAGSRNFALIDPIHQLPITLCSVSPLEWAVVGRQLRGQFGLPIERVWDVSRVYSFDVAPSNAISFLLSKVRNEMRAPGSGCDLLTTAVDPNLGFSGSSYLAANWQRWMTISPRPYIYVDGRYMTPRQLKSTYGSTNLVTVRSQHGVTVEHSRAPLLDSMIFCSRMRGETEYLPPDRQRRVRR